MSRLPDWLRPSPGLAPEPARRVITGAAQKLDPNDRSEVARIRKLRAKQPWQDDAWDYRDSIGEIRFAMTFLAHQLERMRVFPAEATDPGVEPVPADESNALPAGLAAAAQDALDRLIEGSAGIGSLLATLGENLEVPGEAYMLGRAVAGGEEWSIRSTSELVVGKGGGYYLAPEPGARGTDLEQVGADAFISRLWTPHPRWSRLADSPMRALVLGGVCEELLLTSRMIRRASKSRLAGAGILIVDQNLDFPAPAGADEDDQSEPFTLALVEAMMTPIGDESSASAVVPIVVRADLAEGKKAMEHLKLTEDVDAQLLDRQDKALRRCAMTLDVPPEVVLGMADVNHWTAWQIDDSTFRQHVEPLVLRGLKCFTEGYLHAVLLAQGFTTEQVRSVVFWYDPSEVVTNPNRSDDAKAGHSSLVLSDEVLVTTLGFNPKTDMPDDDERLRRMAEARGSVDPPLTEAMLKIAMAELENKLLVDRAKTQADPGAPVQPASPAPGEGEPAAGPSPIPQPAVTPAAGPVAASALLASAALEKLQRLAFTGAPETDEVHGPVLSAHVRASRRLATLDRALRDRLAAAVDSAMRRALERAGNRVKTQANRDNAARAIVASVPARSAYASLSQALLASLALDPQELLDGAWSELQDQWNAWTVAAREEAVGLALSLAGVSLDDPGVQDRVQYLTRGFDAHSAEAWAFLVKGLDRMALAALTDPAAIPEQAAGAPAEPADFPLTPSGVLLSLVRGALALLGGLPAGHAGVTPDGTAAHDGERLAGPATGDLIDGFMTGVGVEVIAYEWVYGISDRHFEPHRALDGVTFAHFGDPVLDNPDGPGGWPFPTLAPGDHRGCHCDAMPIYADGTSAADAARQVGDSTYDPSYLAVLAAIADDDLAAGRYDTTPLRTLMEAERVASSRPSRGPVPTPYTDAVKAATSRKK